MKKKSLSAKKKIHKSLLKHLKNKRINKIFKEFKYILDFFLKRKTDNLLSKQSKFAVAVSGGPDSLALVFLSKCFLLKNKTNSNIKFFIVDHKLRNESSREARSLKKFLIKFDIKSDILEWKGRKPTSNIQAIARKHRYDLIKKACKKNKITNLLTGHHKDDLYENFFIRMLRGSGLKGLISFADLSINLEDNFRILRPLIKIQKKELIYISKSVFNFFVNDPSNENLGFQRSRIRKLILDLENEGLDKKKLDLTINNLKSADSVIKIYVEKNIKNNAKYLINRNKYILNQKFFTSQANEVVFRSFSEILKKVSGKYYPPRGTKIKDAISKCMFSYYKEKSEIKSIRASDIKFTLGGCYIERINQTVIVSKEK